MKFKGAQVAGFLSLAFLAGSVSQAESPRVRCWGANESGQSTPPSGLALVDTPVDPALVQTSLGRTCVLARSGVLNCWGHRILSSTWLEGLQGVETFSLSTTGACAVVGGKVICKSDASDKSIESVPAMSGVKELGVGPFVACALLEKEVKCWGSDRYDTGISNVPNFKDPKKLVVGFTSACVLAEGRVQCWGDPIDPFPKVVPRDIVAIGGRGACILAGGKVTCDSDSLGIPPQLKNPIQLAGGREHICALDSNGVKCWGRNEYRQLEVPSLRRPRAIFGGAMSHHTCALDDSGVVCWGENTFGQTRLGSVAALEAGLRSTCILIRGKVVCWGEGAWLSQVPKGDLYTDLHIGEGFGCSMGFTPSLENACWGTHSNAVLGGPMTKTSNDSLSDAYELQPFQLALGYRHGCIAEKRDGVSLFRCWGNNDFGQTIVPTTGLSVAPHHNGAIAAGGAHTCVLNSTDQVACWGRDDFGQSSPPSLRHPMRVTAGFLHTCALDDNGVRCWGRGSEGQTKVPPLKHPREIEAGGYHTCALDDTGVHCWGDNTLGQSTVPGDVSPNVERVSAGMYHTCVVSR